MVGSRSTDSRKFVQMNVFLSQIKERGHRKMSNERKLFRIKEHAFGPRSKNQQEITYSPFHISCIYYVSPLLLNFNLNY